jgi:SAM-dependent methyltransferase
MHEILRHLRAGSRVLDLGCRGGSFDPSLYPLRTVRVDIEAVPDNAPVDFVQADAASLPFPDGSFDVIIANHSLEHFENLHAALKELARVVKPQGSLYIAVPDSSVFCDWLYRWLASGGGHVNAFTSRENLIASVERHTGMHIAGSRSLLTSFSFLNRKNSSAAIPRKLMVLGGGREGILVLLSALARLLDRRLHTRLSLYGWALYFGDLEEEVDARPWSNVCVRCGSGSASEFLQARGLVHRTLRLIKSYRCPSCGAWNPFTQDQDYAHLR